MELTYYGCALITLKCGDFKLLLDPYFSRNPKTYSPEAEYFDDVDAVLITHGHFDHIDDLPALTERNPNLPIYCTERVKKNLKTIGIKGGDFRLFKPGDSFKIGPLNVKSIKSVHIKYDFAYIALHAVSPDFYRRFFKSFKAAADLKRSPIDGECLEYLIEGDGESVLVAGSLGVDDTIKHPENVDVFVLPYNGRWIINKQMYDHVKRIKPKKIFMSHFDPAFPPMCLDAKPQRFVNFMRKMGENIDIIIPEYEKVYKVKEETAHKTAANL